MNGDGLITPGEARRAFTFAATHGNGPSIDDLIRVQMIADSFMLNVRSGLKKIFMERYLLRRKFLCFHFDSLAHFIQMFLCYGLSFP